MKRIKLLCLFLGISVIAMSQTPILPAGTGTSGDPYQIASLDNLYWLSQTTTAWSAGTFFIQTADIDATATAGWSGGGWTPIGNATTQFKGNYNGDNHTISHLSFSRPTSIYNGFFGYTDAAAIRNIGLPDIAMAGYEYAGGTPDTYEGGLVGYAYDTDIFECYTTGAISGLKGVGGLIGYANQGSEISFCYSTASVTGYYDTGGLIGKIWNNCLITNCYNSGDVTGGNTCGGFTGIIINSEVSDCYCRAASVSGYSFTGGFAGALGGTISRCYSTAGLTGSLKNGFCDSSPSNDNFWDVETDNIDGNATGDVNGAVGKTTAEMQTQATFTSAGWDFSGVWSISPGINDGYPVLNPSLAPTVTTQAINNIAATTATGNGNITVLGVPNPKAYGVCWKKTGTPTTADSKVDKGKASATGAFTAAMTGLTANTSYVVRAYATNSTGTVYGAEESFTTNKPPTVEVTGSLNAFTFCTGSASEEQSFTVSGKDLSGNIVITAPDGFEISTTSGSGFAGSLTLDQIDGTVSITTISVRVTDTAAGDQWGYIVISTTGADSQYIWASGFTGGGSVSASGTTLTITLACKTGVTVVSAGTSYTFTLSTGYWSGSADGISLGETVLTITEEGLSAYELFHIIDGETGAWVTFDDSGTNEYTNDFSILLDQGAGATTFNGTSNFTGSSSIEVTTDNTIILNNGSALSTVDGDLTLSANIQPVASDFEGNGIAVLGGVVQATGKGQVTLKGKAGNSDSFPPLSGIKISSEGKILGGTEGNLTLIGNSMEFDKTSIVSASASNSVLIRQLTNGVAIDLGSAESDAPGGPLRLSADEMGCISGGSIMIGDANTGTITLSNPVTLASNLVLANQPVSYISPAAAGTDLTMTGKDLSFASGSSLKMLINGLFPDEGHDRLIVDGDVNLTGVNLNLSGGITSSPGQKLTILSATSVTGKFNGLGDGSAINVNGIDLIIRYTTKTVYLREQGNPALVVTATEGAVGPAQYDDLQSVFEAINAGTYQGAITIKMLLRTYEESNAVLNASGTGLANYSSVNLFPTAPYLSIVGNYNGPLIDLNGADHFTLNGRVEGGNMGSDMTIINYHTTSPAFRFINDASHNTIQYCRIYGKNESTDAAEAGVIQFSTTTGTTGNDDNLITNNIIGGTGNDGRPVYLIYSSGSGTPGAENSENVISSNWIQDFLHNRLPTAGICLQTYSTAWTISDNSFYETWQTAAPDEDDNSLTVIKINSGGNHSITGNFIGGSSHHSYGTWIKPTFNNEFTAIDFNGGSSVASNIDGNIIKGFNFTNSGSASWYGIHVKSGSVNIGKTLGNTIGASTGNSSISIINGAEGGSFNGILVDTEGIADIQNNTIGSIDLGNTDPLYGIAFYGIKQVAGTNNANISNNLIGSTITSSSIRGAYLSQGDNMVEMAGIYFSGAANTGNSAVISGNTVANMTTSSVHSDDRKNIITGMFLSSAGLITITDNIISDLSIANVSYLPDPKPENWSQCIMGMNMVCTNNGTEHTDAFSGNTVKNLSVSNPVLSGTIVGITVTSANNLCSISSNFVTGMAISEDAASGTVVGLQGQCKTATVFNNIINLDGSSSSTLYGLGDLNKASNLYFNTVNIGGNLKSGTNMSTAFIALGSYTTNDYRNNIFTNTRSNSGSAGGAHYALYIPAISDALTCDYNDYFVSGAGGMLAKINNTNMPDLLSIAAATGNDEHSKAINPVFATPGGSSATDYFTGADLPGIAISGITTDYQGTTRVTYNMGALVPACTNPTIFTQPQSLLVYPGYPAVFSVVASGSAPFSYQWAKDAVDVTDSISDSYTIKSIVGSDAGSYTVTVTNDCGYITSEAAVLTIAAAYNANSGVAYATITEAINAATSGDVIHIHQGTYDEDLVATAAGLGIILSPGASPGCVTINNLTLDGNDGLNMEILGTTACTQHDQFLVNGVVTLGGVSLNLTVDKDFTPLASHSFTLIQNDLTDAISGQFAQGSKITVGSYTFSIQYNGGDGNDVMLYLSPTVNCPGDVKASFDAGATTATVNGIAPTVTGNGTSLAYTIEGATIVASGSGDASGRTFNSGESTVTYTVTDAAGNNAVCSFTVTVSSFSCEAPVIESHNNAYSRNSSQVKVNKPHGTAAGDLLVTGLMCDFNDEHRTLSITPPAGWLLIERKDKTDEIGIATYYKVAGNYEPTSYTFCVSREVEWAAGITRISGADPKNPIGAHQMATGSGYASVTAPAIAVANDAGLILAFYSNLSRTTFTPAKGTIERYDSPGYSISNMMAWYTQPSAGYATAKTAIPGRRDSWVAGQVEIRSACSVVPPVPCPAEWISSSTARGESKTAIASRPSGKMEGDLMIAGLMHLKGSWLTIAPPAGWTLIQRKDISDDLGLATYYKIAGSYEPSSYTFTMGTKVKWSLGISLVTGVDPDSPIMAVNSSTGYHSRNVVAPSVTTDADNTLILGFFTSKSSTSFAAPAGLTERYDYSGSTPANMMASWISETAGSTGFKNALSSYSEDWVAQQVAIGGNCGVKNGRILEPIQNLETSPMENILVYPNPTSGEVNIDLGIEEPGEINVTVLNLLGAEVFQQNFSPANRISLNIAQYKSGVYLVKITYNGGTCVRKIMLER